MFRPRPSSVRPVNALWAAPPSATASPCFTLQRTTLPLTQASSLWTTTTTTPTAFTHYPQRCHYATQQVDNKSRPVEHYPASMPKNVTEQTGALKSGTSNTDAAPGTSPSTRNILFHDLTIDDVIKRKKRLPSDVATVSEDDSTFETIAKMTKLNVGAVLVKNAEGKVAGIFTERDYMTKCALKGLSSKQVPVKQLMTRNFHWIGAENTVVDCMRIMTTNHFRHLPVHDNKGELLGIVSIGDLLVSVLNEYHDAVEYYKQYIGGDYSSSQPRDDMAQTAAAAAPHVK